MDSSTQSCKIVIRDAESGELLREGRAPHPLGTEVDPAEWLRALHGASAAAGDLGDVDALAVGAQQHGMVALDEAGDVVRHALLWNDTRSADAATELIDELGGREAWTRAVGVVPVASFTITKLRWLAHNEPENLVRTAAVCLPHDWLTWHLAGAGDLDAVVTDRGDASGTGYWSASSGYRTDLLELACGKVPLLPRVLGPSERAGATQDGAALGPGTGDNAAAALGLGAAVGDLVLSLGTSGVACARAEDPVRDPTGTVAGFADATGGYLPLVATLNGTQVLDATAALLGIDLARLSDLALSVAPGAEGLVFVPYLSGERTPDRPDATGALHGLTLHNSDAAHVARAAVEGVLCGLAEAVDAICDQGVEVRRILLIGGGARLEAVRQIAAQVLARPIVVPEPSEYVADGAARQAAWVLSGLPEPPDWKLGPERTYEAEPAAHVRERYAQARDHIIDRT